MLETSRKIQHRCALSKNHSLTISNCNWSLEKKNSGICVGFFFSYLKFSLTSRWRLTSSVVQRVTTRVLKQLLPLLLQWWSLVFTDLFRKSAPGEALLTSDEDGVLFTNPKHKNLMQHKDASPNLNTNKPYIFCKADKQNHASRCASKFSLMHRTRSRRKYLKSSSETHRETEREKNCAPLKWVV